MRPILIRVDTDAGHGAGKPVDKQLDERADVLAFLEHALGPLAGAYVWDRQADHAPAPDTERPTRGVGRASRVSGETVQS